MELLSFFRDQLRRYPACEADDLLKALYQRVLGCGHFAPEEAKAAAWLQQEISALCAEDGAPAVESLGEYSRMHLSPALAQGLRPETLLKLFLLSAQPETPEKKARQLQGVNALEAFIREGALPLAQDAALARLSEYRAQGCPSLHHSGTFRAAYRPAYRVVRTAYAQLLPLFCRIDALLAAEKPAVVAIDGCCASGKSTLAALLSQVYGADVLHMDDFFLQPHQRTEERLAKPGENVDHERFLAEVLQPLHAGKPFCYRRYDCGTQTILPGVEKRPGRLTVVEGSYSLHPALAPYYDLQVCLTIGADAQSARILHRNGPAMHERFVKLWIPLENRYFGETAVHSRCDLLLQVTPDETGENRYEVISK